MVKSFTQSYKYQIVNGTAYHINTPMEVINLLEKARLNHTRIRFCLGDTITGLDWGETYDVCGRLGRSTGSYRIPLLLKRVSSIGGGGLLDHCIIRIEFKDKNVYKEVYRHPTYHIKNH